MKKILKGARSPASEPGKIVRGEVFQASAEAREILQKARQEAARLLREARRRRREMLEEGRRQGYQQGLQEWLDTNLELRERAQRYVDDLEPEVVRLALQVARKLVGSQLELQPELVTGMVREALRSLPKAREIEISVCPKDVARVREVLQEDAQYRRQVLKVVEDPRLEPGDCRLESELGIVDARLDVQLQVLEKLLVRPAEGE